MLQIIADSITYPRLFRWNGKMLDKDVMDWIHTNSLTPSKDLINLWCCTGGGDFFESETILGPFADITMADDVLSVNRYHWERGMPVESLIFHKGLGGLTASIANLDEVVVLDIEDYQERARYSSMDVWYIESIRSEYAERYGLDKKSILVEKDFRYK